MARRHNSDSGSGGVLRFNKATFEKLVKVCPQFKSYKEDWEYRDPDHHIKIAVRKFSIEALQHALKIYREHVSDNPGNRWAIGQIEAHIAVMENPSSKKVENLRALETAIIAYVRKHAINGWFFVKKESLQVMQAMLIHNVEYHPAYTVGEGKDKYMVPACVNVRLIYWSQEDRCSKHFSWGASQVVGKTVEQILAEASIYPESKALITLYEQGEKQFLAWRKQLGEQFVGNGVFDGQDDGEEGGWWRRKRTHDSEMKDTRLVVDDRCKAIDNRYNSIIFADNLDPEVEDQGSDPSEEEMDRFTRLPLEFFIYCYNMSSNRGDWVHMNAMKPYIYRPEIRSKLILPPEHEDLIDALTSDMEVVMEDIVLGKSGGTAILCQGKAGTGKTLTAEVYSEVIKRPLYRVHSGQLGISADSVEEALKKALDNAKRWRAVMLIDEADVFVSQRGGDLAKNAVVGVFLRVLEYYDGLLFLTTNRTEDIDEAILSRCIAQIKYVEPAETERVKLWKTLGEVYGLELVKKKDMPEKLAAMFKCTGRDIKGLIKLVTKYCKKHKRTPALEDFKRMAVFKGL